jgi:hypothetical protein
MGVDQRFLKQQHAPLFAAGCCLPERDWMLCPAVFVLTDKILHKGVHFHKKPFRFFMKMHAFFLCGWVGDSCGWFNTPAPGSYEGY